MDEKFQSFYCDLHFTSPHRSTSIYHERVDILSFYRGVNFLFFKLLLVVYVSNLLLLIILRLCCFEGWHELSHDCHVSWHIIGLLVNESWLIHISCLVVDMHIFLKVSEVTINLLNHYFIQALLKDFTVGGVRNLKDRFCWF